MVQHPRLVLFFRLSSPALRRRVAGRHASHTAAEEPQLEIVADKADLEKRNFPVLLGNLQGCRHRFLPLPAVVGLDPFQHAVGTAVEPIGWNQHTAQALVSPLVVEGVDPGADLLLGVQEVAELHPIDELLLDGLVQGLDLAALCAAQGYGWFAWAA